MDPVLITAGLGLALSGVAAIAGHLHGTDTAHRATRAELTAAFEEGRQAERVAAGPQPPMITFRPARAHVRGHILDMTRLDIDRVPAQR